MLNSLSATQVNNASGRRPKHPDNKRKTKKKRTEPQDIGDAARQPGRELFFCTQLRQGGFSQVRTDKYVIAKEPRSQRRRYSGTYRLRTHWLPLIVMILALGVIAPAVAAQSKLPSFDGSRTYFALGGTTNGVTAVATGDFNG